MCRPGIAVCVSHGADHARDRGLLVEDDGERSNASTSTFRICGPPRQASHAVQPGWLNISKSGLTVTFWLLRSSVKHSQRPSPSRSLAIFTTRFLAAHHSDE
jgi:hypothetical protein